MYTDSSASTFEFFFLVSVCFQHRKETEMKHFIIHDEMCHKYKKSILQNCQLLATNIINLKIRALNEL